MPRFVSRFFSKHDILKRFCSVGAVGFLVDASVLELALIFGHGPIESRLLSISVALTVTWLLHRIYTFQNCQRHPLSQYGRFVLVGAFGAGLNFAVYSALLFFSPTLLPLLAMILSSAFALLVNYLGARYFAFSA